MHTISAQSLKTVFFASVKDSQPKLSNTGLKGLIRETFPVFWSMFQSDLYFDVADSEVVFFADRYLVSGSYHQTEKGFSFRFDDLGISRTNIFTEEELFGFLIEVIEG